MPLRYARNYNIFMSKGQGRISLVETKLFTFESNYFIFKTRTRNFIVSIGVFATAPIVGITIGIILTECFDQDSVNQVAVQSIQAIATGTVIYVVFFEVFPKGKEIGGTGFQHVIAMTFGFLAFLPTLLMRK